MTDVRVGPVALRMLARTDPVEAAALGFVEPVGRVVEPAWMSDPALAAGGPRLAAYVEKERSSRRRSSNG